MHPLRIARNCESGHLQNRRLPKLSPADPRARKRTDGDIAPIGAKKNGGTVHPSERLPHWRRRRRTRSTADTPRDDHGHSAEHNPTGAALGDWRTARRPALGPQSHPHQSPPRFHLSLPPDPFNSTSRPRGSSASAPTPLDESGRKTPPPHTACRNLLSARQLHDKKHFHLVRRPAALVLTFSCSPLTTTTQRHDDGEKLQEWTLINTDRDG